mmetsp:Transcript_121885/g.344746  ORF Transcript_121885/g.344746 Transcript_121885/m.344746 type:complete len:270 (-) Transcript_121885:3140-3949(-)
MADAGGEKPSLLPRTPLTWRGLTGSGDGNLASPDLPANKSGRSSSSLYGPGPAPPPRGSGPRSGLGTRLGGVIGLRSITSRAARRCGGDKRSSRRRCLRSVDLGPSAGFRRWVLRLRLRLRRLLLLLALPRRLVLSPSLSTGAIFRGSWIGLSSEASSERSARIIAATSRAQGSVCSASKRTTTSFGSAGGGHEFSWEPSVERSCMSCRPSPRGNKRRPNSTASLRRNLSLKAATLWMWSSVSVGPNSRSLCSAHAMASSLVRGGALGS